MRLWHKDLICVLPRQQLCGQWRECCLIAKSISETGFPNHLLVNKITCDDYDESHFVNYCSLVYNEMRKRGYEVNWEKVNIYFTKPYEPKNELSKLEFEKLFCFWHNLRYLHQCYYNLEEKYDCKGISDKNWKLIKDKYNELTLRSLKFVFEGNK